MSPTDDQRGERGPTGDHGQAGDRGYPGQAGQPGQAGVAGERGAPGKDAQTLTRVQAAVIFGFIALAFMVLLVLSLQTRAELVRLQTAQCQDQARSIATINRAWASLEAAERRNSAVSQATRDDRITAYRAARLVVPSCKDQ